MKKEVIEKLLQALPGETSAMRLRLRHVGSLMDPSLLERKGFTRLEDNEDGGSRWAKAFSGGDRRILLDLDAQGMLSRLQLSEFLDLEELHGMGAPFGWYLNEDISARSEAALSKSLATAAERLPDEDARADWDFRFHHVGYFELELGDLPRDAEVIQCSVANLLLEDERILNATVITCGLLRHLGVVRQWMVFHDLPFLAGRLGMQGECAESIRRALTCGREPNAETWCNMGAVLCDTLHLGDTALEFFLHSIELKPSLPVPRRNVWRAGRLAIRDRLLANRAVAEVPGICARVEQVGDPENTIHGYWSYAGLAYGMLGDAGKAKESFERALALDPDCRTAKSGMAALGDIGRYSYFAPARILEDSDFSHLKKEK